MNPSTTHDGIQPDLEDLAAYLDGLLAEDRRAAVEARLAEDPEYYEVFLDTVRFREEEGLGDSEEGHVAPPPLQSVKASEVAFQRWSVPLALAAGLLLVLLWQPWVSPLEKRLPNDFGRAKLGSLEMHSRGWGTMRGTAEPDAEARAVAFRTGAYLVHLELAIRYQDREAAERALGDLYRELNRPSWPLTAVNAQIDELEATLRFDNVPWGDVASGKKELVRLLASVMERGAPEGDALKWGRWSEQVLLLYLEERTDLLNEFLVSPPAGFGNVEEVAEALRDMRAAPKTVPTEPLEETPFLKAHGHLEDALGG